MQRTIKPEDFAAIADTALVLDVRRKEDRDASHEMIEGAIWKDPTQIDEWISAVPRLHDVVIYCVRGGGVSNSVVDRLQAEGVQARFIEGGIEGLKAAGGTVVAK
ncbi:rhodanese-like domain-containing protein [Thiothrix sp.]|jgi:rhodanese-related sulfurtransferase|uniref:rhodanese-like domain-containing protein n=1 Tax=Thiothrix sp. TaxID=1032 RepID=UPI00257E2AC2|nr:rhodanese-like domain-containing protein [Thiothrix sp.]